MTTTVAAQTGKYMEESARILRKAVPQMTALGIPVTPQNYAVWYGYFRADDRALVNAIDALIANGVAFSADVCLGLYNNFIQNNAPEVLENVQLETRLLINGLLNKISQLSKGSAHFQHSMEEFGHQIHITQDTDTLHRLVEGVLVEVDKVIAENATINDSLKSMNDELDSLRSEINELSVVSITDKLTGLYNRRAFEDNLTKVQSLETYGCSLLMVDIDHFKQFNDRWGHSTGDKVLVYVAHQLKMGVKGDDFIARFGGEEFVVILKNTLLENAMLVAESLRSRIANKKLTLGKEQQEVGSVTVSIGVAQSRPQEDPEALFDRADRALYDAKHAGRNQVRSVV
ncbi:GGDEF domain-containing protein [Shewanella jiangmenensis]|uniref:GGDEF domain-containing protein n=1 Tax=Shewanella jiangmenensis TaxID=2837387 RepID=UPI003D7C809C